MFIIVPWMYEMKMHIRHVILCEVKINKNASEAVKKICSVYGQGVIIDCQVRNWFSKFCSGDTSLRDEPSAERPLDLNQECLREVLECKSTQKYSRLST